MPNYLVNTALHILGRATASIYLVYMSQSEVQRISFRFSIAADVADVPNVFTSVTFGDGDGFDLNRYAILRHDGHFTIFWYEGYNYIHMDKFITIRTSCY